MPRPSRRTRLFLLTPGARVATIDHGARAGVLHAYLVRGTGGINWPVSPWIVEECRTEAVEIS
jgi:hypothetical protein